MSLMLSAAGAGADCVVGVAGWELVPGCGSFAAAINAADDTGPLAGLAVD